MQYQRVPLKCFDMGGGRESNSFRVALRAGADVNTRGVCLSSNLQSRRSPAITSTPLPASTLTPLSIAAWAGHFALVQLLVNNGARTDFYDGQGCTPLVAALKQGHQAIAISLFKQLKDPNIPSCVLGREGWTPLHTACFYSYTRAVRAFLKYGANVHAATPQGGHTPAHLLILAREAHAVHPDQTRLMLKLVLDHGADIDAQTKAGDTLLHLCLRHRPWRAPGTLSRQWEGDVDLVQYVLALGAAIDEKARRLIRGHSDPRMREVVSSEFFSPTLLRPFPPPDLLQHPMRSTS